VKRRAFVAGLTAVAAARKVLAAAGADKCRVGICAYSCHQHWNAVQANLPCAKFHDALGFYDYARGLGAEGVQNPLRTTDPAIARKLRAKVEEDGGYYEGDVKLPKTESDLAAFEADVRLAREAGATIARSVFMGTRRYEVFKTMDEFRAFHAQAEKSLSLAEPIISKHRLKLALENHKDHTADELAGMMRRVSSEWIGVLVDVGNNVALLEKPEETVETLAPFALSVHLKDMAITPERQQLMAEVGEGNLNWPGILEACHEAGVKWYIVEQDICQRDPFESLKISFDNLEGMGVQ